MSSALERTPSLRELQLGMRDAICRDGAGLAGALGFVSDMPPIGPEQRLDIYSEAYLLRLIEALEGDFPALKSQLGCHEFSGQAEAYFRAHPSSRFNIGEVGEHLPAFLHGALPSLPWLSELAALEWAVVESFYADDQVQLDPSSLQSVPPEAWPQATFVLGASVRCLRHAHSVESIWRDGVDAAELKATLFKEQCLLLYRGPRGGVEVEVIDSVAWTVLDSIRRGRCLAEICEDLGQLQGDIAPPLMEWFAKWISLGVIGSIRRGDISC